MAFIIIIKNKTKILHFFSFTLRKIKNEITALHNNNNNNIVLIELLLFNIHTLYFHRYTDREVSRKIGWRDWLKMIISS